MKNLREVILLSWTEELYKVHELVQNNKSKDTQHILLPISHSTQNAQIELTISEDGEFVSASKIDKENSETIIPVTEDSGARGNGVTPMPFADKLVYIAGDYNKYATGKKSDNREYYSAYMKQLSKWSESQHSHKAVKAIYDYLSKENLISDLINSSVLNLDESGKLSDKTKIAGIPQEDSFVRFRINYGVDCDNNPDTWKDTTLYDSFMNFNTDNMTNVGLCYATGKETVITYKHPFKIRNSGDKSKLISSNDESGFTYRGRFANKEEAISIGYEFSQKFHNALKWLIKNQGIHIDSLTLIVWSSGLQFVPNPTISLNSYDEEDDDDLAEIEYDPATAFKGKMQKFIFGCKKSLEISSKVMIMGLDAATTGRLSISEYAEIDSSRYIDNIAKWHEETKCLRFNNKNKRNEYDSFSIKNIANCAFGIETGNFIKCKEEVLKETTLRLLPCITQGAKLPRDIMNALVHKASNPLAYDNKYNHRNVLETACGMIQKYYIDHNDKKGRIYMGYDPNITDRSYLFGCLLAIADKAEHDTYEKGEERITNARRYWNVFSSRPYQTWQTIEEKLRPYLDKRESANIYYQRLINSILEKMSPEDFSSTKRLEPLYLLGYHHYTNELYSKNNKSGE